MSSIVCLLRTGTEAKALVVELQEEMISAVTMMKTYHLLEVVEIPLRTSLSLEGT